MRRPVGIADRDFHRTRLPDDVAVYIASSIKSNVRELEGALIRLAAYASLSTRRMDLGFAFAGAPSAFAPSSA